MAGLESQRRRPRRSPNQKVKAEERDRILQLRALAFGTRRIQSERRLHHERDLSLSTIHKILATAQVKPLSKPRRSVIPKR